MQYLTLYVTNIELDKAFYTLSNVGIQISEEIERGYERMVFLEDPNGTLITLTSWPDISSANTNQNRDTLKRAVTNKSKSISEYLEKIH